MKNVLIDDDRIWENLTGFLNLLQVVRLCNLKTIVELGSFIGSCTVLFAKYFPEATITAVDLWEGGYDANDDISEYDFLVVEEIFDCNIKYLPNVHKIKRDVLDYTKDINDKSIDLVYFDATHTYQHTKDCLMQWLPKMKDSGIISGHDIDNKGVHKAVVEILGKVSSNYIFEDGSWLKPVTIIRRTNFENPSCGFQK